MQGGGMPEAHPTETFRDIPGFPGYQVSDLGRVRTRRPINGRGPLAEEWRLIRGNMRRDGYRRVDLNDGQRRVAKGVHWLVLSAFVSPCPPGMECLHDDGDKKNNRLDNLRWGTQKENAADRMRHDHQTWGQEINTAKLTEEDVRTARRLRRSRVHARVICERLGISQQHLLSLCNGKAWNRLQDTEDDTYYLLSPEKLDSLRVSANLSVTDLGKKAGLDPSHVNRVIHGKKNASWRTGRTARRSVGSPPRGALHGTGARLCPGEKTKARLAGQERLPARPPHAESLTPRTSLVPGRTPCYLGLFPSQVSRPLSAPGVR
jgi:hypothetical protein